MLPANLKTILDRKLWGSAERIIAHYRGEGYTVQTFQSIDPDYRYKPHLICRKRYECIAIEIRERCNVESYFETFVIGCQAKRIPVKINFAVPERIDEMETIVSHSQRNILKKIGIGLLIIGEPDIIEDIGTISCSRRFAVEPGSTLGKYKTKIDGIISNYNLGDCLNSVRNLSEEVEDATVGLAKKAAAKNRINISVQDIENNVYSWEDLINCLSANNYRNTPQTRFFDARLSNSMKTFKDVRNLSDHRKTARQLRTLEQRYPEAMLTGIRLLRELIRLKNAA